MVVRGCDYGCYMRRRHAWRRRSSCSFSLLLLLSMEKLLHILALSCSNNLLLSRPSWEVEMPGTALLLLLLLYILLLLHL